MTTMTNPEDPHICEPPPTTGLGGEWTCPLCGRLFRADEEDDHDGTYVWVVVAP